MIVTKLELSNFRSYEKLRLEFEAGLHVFTGPNGAGKTNIVEAIHYLALGRSFRTPKDDVLIKRGSEQTAIRATIKTSKQLRKVAAGLSTNGKKILVNEKPITRISELVELVNVLVFEPRDVLLFEDLPKARRKFLDIALVKHQRGYLDALTRYEKLLKERNELLKHDHVNELQLQVLTEQLINASAPIVSARGQYLEKVNLVLERIVKAVRGAKRGIKLHYLPYTNMSATFQEDAAQLYQKTKELDIKRKLTNVGVHREDFRIDLEEHDVATYGSQGENRLLAIALKLSPYFIETNQDKRPIIVLDDVLSELDQTAQLRLLEFLLKFEQVFITTTQYDKNYGTVYDVADHKVIRRSTNGK